MNPAETAQYAAFLKATLPVMDAFVKGSKVQGRRRVHDGLENQWHDFGEPSWHADYEYRVKPAPRTLYVIECKHKISGQLSHDIRPTWTKEDHESACRKWNAVCDTYEYKVVEYLEQLP